MDALSRRAYTRMTKWVISGAVALLALVGPLCGMTPVKAQAATLSSDLVSFISVATIDAVTSDDGGTGTLEDPYEGTITAPVTSEELMYLSVKFVDDNANGVATYLVSDEAPSSVAAINQPTTNVDGRCNSDEPLDLKPGVYTLWVTAKESATARTAEIYKIQLTVINKTAEPIFTAYTVEAQEGNTTALFTVANAADGASL